MDKDSSKVKSSRKQQTGRRVSRKEQIISLFTSGIDQIEEIAMIIGARPGYVASVLQEAELISGYFDLYTTSAQPMNVYSGFFANKLGFKDEATARESVELIDHYYRQFELAEDRAGQHHALMMALTMFNRARWIDKGREAEIFRQWLVNKLNEADLSVERETENEDQITKKV
jgi:tRNA threonylcarbamoyladenosine modification (KEOPS) complex Cgi121 subunit